MEKTISFFADFYESVKFLSDDLFGTLMRAAIEYQLTGQEYSGDNPMILMGFNFAKNQADRKKEFGKKQSENVKKRWNKQEDTEQENIDTNVYAGVPDNESKDTGIYSGYQIVPDDTKRYQMIPSDTPNPSPSPSPNPIPDIINSLSIAGANGENFAGEPQKPEEPKAPAKLTRKSYGQFGWVNLSEKEYTALVNDLGQAEAERCIAYVDECAQSNGNKNKWRDWNLVVRKCSRDKWGVSAPKITFQGRQRPERPGDIHGCSEPGPAEMEAIARSLRQDPDEFLNWNRRVL